MLGKPVLIACMGIFYLFAIGVTDLSEGGTAEEQADRLAAQINAGQFSGRRTFEVEISAGCQVLYKKINPKCPDQRGEVSFNVAEIRASVDSVYIALFVNSASQRAVITERLYYRGDSAKNRRFCKAPEGAPLRSDERTHTQFLLFTSDDIAFLMQLKDGFNALSTACGHAKVF